MKKLTRARIIRLNFGLGNAKLSKAIATFSLPAGHACPFAKECMSRAARFTGKITDGPQCRFRCFAAMSEARATPVRFQRWGNFEKLKACQTVEEMANLIQKSLPWGVSLIRVHVSGDFFSEKYFLAWLNVAYNNPHVIFYGYTKAIPFLVKYKRFIPDNFRFTASFGGTHDHLIVKHNLKFAKVFFSVEEAEAAALEIDHDDTHALAYTKSFALLLHGTQPPGTEASRAWMKLIRAGIGGYGGNTNSRNVMFERKVTIHITTVDGKPVRVKQIKAKIERRQKKSKQIPRLLLPTFFSTTSPFTKKQYA